MTESGEEVVRSSGDAMSRALGEVVLGPISSGRLTVYVRTDKRRIPQGGVVALSISTNAFPAAGRHPPARQNPEGPGRAALGGLAFAGVRDRQSADR